MKASILTLIGVLGLASSTAHAQDIATAHSVVYVEVQATEAAHAATVAALAAYDVALSAQEGFVGLESFEQVGRAGHLVLIENWRDQAALDGQDLAAQQQFAAALDSVRTSNIDRRPYKAVYVSGRQPAGEDLVYVISHVDAAPGGDTAAILQALVDNSRKESGNLRFDLMQHVVRGNHYTVVEVWANSAALDSHVTAPHTRSFRDAFGPLAGSPLDERIFTALPVR